MSVRVSVTTTMATDDRKNFSGRRFCLRLALAIDVASHSAVGRMRGARRRANAAAATTRCSSNIPVTTASAAASRLSSWRRRRGRGRIHFHTHTFCRTRAGRHRLVLSATRFCSHVQESLCGHHMADECAHQLPLVQSCSNSNAAAESLTTIMQRVSSRCRRHESCMRATSKRRRFTLSILTFEGARLILRSRPPIGRLVPSCLFTRATSTRQVVVVTFVVIARALSSRGV